MGWENFKFEIGKNLGGGGGKRLENEGRLASENYRRCGLWGLEEWKSSGAPWGAPEVVVGEP